MKIAAGCFGCLAFVFLGLFLAWGVLMAALMPMLPADMQTTLAPVMAYANYANGGCCCLSGVLCVALLAAGSMRNREPIE